MRQRASSTNPAIIAAERLRRGAPQQALQEPGRSDRRQRGESGEVALAPLDFLAEAATVRASAQVGADVAPAGDAAEPLA